MAGRQEDFVSPLDGVEDIDGEVDVAAEVRQALGGGRTRSSADPIRAAADGLRDDDEDDTTEDDAAAAAEEEEAEADEDAEDDAAAEGDEEAAKGEGDEKKGEGEEDAAEGEEAEGDEESEDKKDEAEGDEAAPPPKGRDFAVEVPGARRGESFEFAGLTQEQHDVLTNHISRSRELDVARVQLGQLREHEQVATFVEDHPLEAMLLLDKEDQNTPHPKAVGQQFAENWMRANPESALKLIEKLGYHDADRLDPERLKERAESAQGKNEKLVDTAVKATRGRLGQDRFVSETGAILKQIGDHLELGGEDLRDFISLAAQRIKRVYDSRMENGRDPRLTRKEVLKLSQPVIQRFAQANGNGRRAAGESGKGAGKNGSTRVDVRERLARRESVEKRHAKVSGGTGASPALSGGLQVTKFKGAKGVREAAARLRKA